MLVAEIEVDQLRGEVEVPPAGLVPEGRTLAAGDDDRVEGPLGGPRGEDVRAVVAVRVGALSRHELKLIAHVRPYNTRSVTGCYRAYPAAMEITSVQELAAL